MADAALMQNSEALVQVRGLSKAYANDQEKLVILQEVDFDLNAGETVAVVGASGLGKSTFLHLLGTLDRPDAGSIKVNGVNVFGLNDEKLAAFRNREIGFVFQFHHLLAEFSALENTMMPALIAGQSKPQALRAAMELLERVGLHDRLDYRVNKLSGGEQQRVALARALVMRPKLLLADEPTGNLDRENKQVVHQLLLELNRELGTALVVVTHSAELASCMSKRVTIADYKLKHELDYFVAG